MIWQEAVLILWAALVGAGFALFWCVFVALIITLVAPR